MSGTLAAGSSALFAAPRHANQHLQTARQPNLLASSEGRSSQTPYTANHGSDGGPCAPEDRAQQSSCSETNRRVLDGLAASPARLDGAFHIHFLARRRVIKLDDLGADQCPAAMRHDQTAVLQHHCCVTLDLPGQIDLRDV